MQIESRCGILCSDCEFDCPGCTQIEKPFWGESCPVKSCAEQAGLSHCGQCEKFPCPLLNGFAYDPEQGDDGKRIRQCAQWLEKEKGASHSEKAKC
ncbi:MAG: DUF3795 domain-containing protein [Provencibacterium sp.]|jgi:hypothetical protein|nr:DUF3795 domain-containing protein [Provencibacterium sp.]